MCVRACVRVCVWLRCALQEGDKRVIRDKIVEVFSAGDKEQACRRFNKEVDC
jgi:hypothetical protein